MAAARLAKKRSFCTVIDSRWNPVFFCHKFWPINDKVVLNPKFMSSENWKSKPLWWWVQKFFAAKKYKPRKMRPKFAETWERPLWEKEGPRDGTYGGTFEKVELKSLVGKKYQEVRKKERNSGLFKKLHRRKRFFDFLAELETETDARKESAEAGKGLNCPSLELLGAFDFKLGLSTSLRKISFWASTFKACENNLFLVQI